MSMPPVASIVIPAHNESSVISRCLAAFASNDHEQWQVVVVCNGCTDDTAQVARATAPWATVVEIDVASKAAALNAGDAVADVFPRIYLDADIELSAAALLATVKVLEDEAVFTAAPRPYFATQACPWFVKAFYRAWERTDFLQA